MLHIKMGRGGLDRHEHKALVIFLQTNKADHAIYTLYMDNTRGESN